MNVYSMFVYIYIYTYVYIYIYMYTYIIYIYIYIHKYVCTTYIHLHVLVEVDPAAAAGALVAKGLRRHEVVRRLHADADVLLVHAVRQLDLVPELGVLGVVLHVVELLGRCYHYLLYYDC